MSAGQTGPKISTIHFTQYSDKSSTWFGPKCIFATYFIRKTSRNLSDKRVVASRWRYSHALPPSKMPLPGTLLQKRCLCSSSKFYILRALISSKPTPARIYFLSIVTQLCCVPFHKEIWTLSKRTFLIPKQVQKMALLLTFWL